MSLDPKSKDFGDEIFQGVVGFVCGALAGIPVGLLLYRATWIFLPMSRTEGLLLITVPAAMLVTGILISAIAIRKGPRFWEDIQALFR